MEEKVIDELLEGLHVLGKDGCLYKMEEWTVDEKPQFCKIADIGHEMRSIALFCGILYGLRHDGGGVECQWLDRATAQGWKHISIGGVMDIATAGESLYALCSRPLTDYAGEISKVCQLATTKVLPSFSQSGSLRVGCKAVALRPCFAPMLGYLDMHAGAEMEVWWLPRNQAEAEYADGCCYGKDVGGVIGWAPISNLASCDPELTTENGSTSPRSSTVSSTGQVRPAAKKLRMWQSVPTCQERSLRVLETKPRPQLVRVSQKDNDTAMCIEEGILVAKSLSHGRSKVISCLGLPSEVASLAYMDMHEQPLQPRAQPAAASPEPDPVAKTPPAAAAAQAGASPVAVHRMDDSSTAGDQCSSEDTDTESAEYENPWLMHGSVEGVSVEGHGRRQRWGEADANDVASLSKRMFKFARDGNMEKTIEMLDEGADIHASAGDGRTALHCAAGGGCPGLVEALIQRGADVNAEEKFGKKPVDDADYWSCKKPTAGDADGLRSRCLQCVDLLLTAGGRRSVPGDRCDSIQTDHLRLERFAEDRGLLPPWKMPRYNRRPFTTADHLPRDYAPQMAQSAQWAPYTPPALALPSQQPVRPLEGQGMAMYHMYGGPPAPQPWAQQALEPPSQTWHAWQPQQQVQQPLQTWHALQPVHSSEGHVMRGHAAQPQQQPEPASQTWNWQQEPPPMDACQPASVAHGGGASIEDDSYSDSNPPTPPPLD
eukprot:TRINITY_DN27921_c0_g1_i1.p1 TRINITY_DN27921_c0_g1~~TRINITY_DN27921_c0_g1_i1.p1  ORF type:complete len:714 (+),score=106.09 TRINITY_DN27921_c0_g1_i1:183-2324(+)